MPFYVPTILLVALVAVPWLWPFTFGPQAAVQPYLVSAALGVVTLLLWPRGVGGVGRGVRAAAWGWLAAALISSGIALLQYFDVEALLFPWVNVAKPGQAFGNLRQPNQLATLLLIGLLALRWLAQRRALAGQRPPLWLPVAAALVLAALAATASRVGLLGLVLVCALALWWSRLALPSFTPSRRRAWLAVGLALGVYAAAALLLPLLLQQGEGVAGRSMVDRLQNAESTCGSRLILWRNVLHLIALKPWLGWGWGDLSYAHYITLYPGPRFCHILDNAHNLPLHLAVTLGVPAALAICAALAWAVWRARPWAEADPTRQLAWGVLLVIGVHSLVEYPLWYGPFQIAALISVWLLWATRAGARPTEDAEDVEEVDAPPAAWAVAARVGLCAALLAVLGYADWDYQRVSQLYLPVEKRAPAWRDEPMRHARQSRLFAGVVRFAEVTTRPVTRENASWMLEQSLQALHFSPEPRVITQVIESATRLGRDELALAHLARFRAAFPAEHRQWAEDNERALQGAQDLLLQAVRDSASVTASDSQP